VKPFGSHVKSEVLDITSLEVAAVERRESLVKSSDLVISFLPATLHVGIAKLVVKHKKLMVTASYVSPEMESLDAEARAAGALIINEVGLDPGIDHMSAMQMIDAAKARGGCVMSFSSLCGGLPAPEVAGSNPIGYKFSWSPKGVLLAARNASRFKDAGKLREIPGPDLLASAKPLMLNNAFSFDVLPNRDCTVFADLYGLSDAPTFFRGTFRYHGFCSRMLALARLGLLEPGPVPSLMASRDARWSCRDWLAQVLGLQGAKGVD
jgi:saccharopine dehydrogenase-like NADP-dependent oxidoreductase